MNYSQVQEISGPSIKIDRRREEPREVRLVVGISVENIVSRKKAKYSIDIVSNEKKRIARGWLECSQNATRL